LPAEAEGVALPTRNAVYRRATKQRAQNKLYTPLPPSLEGGRGAGVKIYCAFVTRHEV